MSETFDTRALRNALGQFPTGVTVVTCRDEKGERCGMTANSFSSVSLNPPLILWSVDRSARSAPAFEATQSFAVCVLGEGQVDIAHRFAQGGLDKFSGIDTPSGIHGAPLIPGALATFQCTQHSLADGGDHVIILGLVRAFSSVPGVPMVFAQGRFAHLAVPPRG